MAKKRSKQRPSKVEVVYSRGKVRYLLVNGVISWGLVTGTLIATLQSLWQNGFSYTLWRQNLFSAQGAMIVMFFSVAGLIWSHVTWSWVVRRAHELGAGKNKKQKRNETVQPS